MHMHVFSARKMHLKMLSAKWWPFCLGHNVLILLLWHFFCHYWACHSGGHYWDSYPGALSLKSLQLIWRLGTCRFHLHVPYHQTIYTWVHNSVPSRSGCQAIYCALSFPSSFIAGNDEAFMSETYIPDEMSDFKYMLILMFVLCFLLSTYIHLQLPEICPQHSNY